MRILSFDLGDFNAASAWYVLDEESGEVRRGSVTTSRSALSTLLAELRPGQVLCEACTMTALLCDVCEEVVPSAKFLAANTNAEAWRWTQAKRKTDESDAERLVRLFRLKELVPVLIPALRVRAVRRALLHRQQLVYKRTACYNAIRHACKMQGIGLGKSEAAWSAAGLKSLQELIAGYEEANVDSWWKCEVAQLLELLEALSKHIADVEEKLKRWREEQPAQKNLLSVPGVGPIVTVALLAILVDPQRFRTGKQVAAYAGLVPRIFQSGKMERTGHISKSGNRTLRALMVNAAWVAIRNDDWAKKTFERILGSTTSRARRKIAITAVARRLLVRCWAIMRDGTDWKPQEKTTDTSPPPDPKTTRPKRTRNKKTTQQPITQ